MKLWIWIAIVIFVGLACLVLGAKYREKNPKTPAVGTAETVNTVTQ